MLVKPLSRLIGNYVRLNHINYGMPPKWSATLVEEFLDSNLSIKEYFKWERPLLLPRNYNINKNLKFNPKSGLAKIHILPFYSVATFSASLQSMHN